MHSEKLEMMLVRLVGVYTVLVWHAALIMRQYKLISSKLKLYYKQMYVECIFLQVCCCRHVLTCWVDHIWLLFV